MLRDSSSTNLRQKGEGLRVLFLLTFTPSVNARHGGRATAGLIARLAERHKIALVYLRAPEEEPVDELLLRRCALVEAVEAAPGALRRARLLLSLARGRPLEVFDSWSPELARRFRAVAEAWRPDLVQLEVERTAQYVHRPVPSASVLAAHEAAGEKARDIYHAARGAERLFRYLDLRAWRRFEPKALRSVDAVVCFTERDRRALS